MDRWLLLNRRLRDAKDHPERRHMPELLEEAATSLEVYREALMLALAQVRQEMRPDVKTFGDVAELFLERARIQRESIMALGGDIEEHGDEWEGDEDKDASQ